MARARGIDGSCSSVEFAVICIESITSLCWGGSPRLLFLVYVWLSCRAVSAVVCIESIPAYAGVVVPGLSFLVYVWLSCRAVVLAKLTVLIGGGDN